MKKYFYQLFKNLIIHILNITDVVTRKLPAIGYFNPSTGWFSALQLLKNQRLNGKILIEKQDLTAALPDSMTRKSGMNQTGYQPWPVFWVVSNNALLMGKIALWRDDETKLLCEEAAYFHRTRRGVGEIQLGARCWVPKVVNLPGAWTSIASNWGSGRNYYHWITDNLTRLLVRETLPEKTQILIPDSQMPFVQETLELLGLGDKIQRISGIPLKPERFYFCSPTAMTGTANPAGFEWLKKSFSPYFNDHGGSKPIFLTRRSCKRVPSATEDIERLFESAGFEIIDCSKLTVKDQISKLNAASAVAGFHGAAMTNILWCRPQTPVLEIFQPDFLNGCYEQIAVHGCLAYDYLIIHEDSYVTDLTQWITKGGFEDR